jgi:molybdopterin-guanine dinucleotide biosynthesis protein MobB
VKVIPVTGLSGSGKTTFIRTLIPVLARFGPVGTIKHTGHHSMELPKGKDTTVMFEAGASAVAGIDQGKTLVTLKGTVLTDALDILAGQGIALAIIEGYKGSSLPKIIIGDLEAEECVLQDPDPEDVIPVIDRFPDYITPGELLRELGLQCRSSETGCTIISSSQPLPADNRKHASVDTGKVLSDVTGAMLDLPGVTGAKAAIQRGSLFGGNDRVLMVVAGDGGEVAAAALGAALSRFRDIMDGREADGGTRGN